MPTPGTYYDMLPERLEEIGVGGIDENIDVCASSRSWSTAKATTVSAADLPEGVGQHLGDPRPGPFFFEIIQRKGERASARATSARCSRASSASRRTTRRRRAAVVMLDARRGAATVATKHHIALRDGRRAALRGVPDARRVRRAVHDPLSPRAAARAAAVEARRTAGRRRRRRRRAAAAAQAPLPVAASCRAQRRRRRSMRACRCCSTATSCSASLPTAPDPIYFANGDGDDLVYVHEGGGTLRSVLGDVRFAPGDYVFVPRGLLHRFVPDGRAQYWLSIRMRGRLRPAAAVAQRRRTAAHGRALLHRDFKRPQFAGPRDEGIRELVVQARRRVPRLRTPSRRSTSSAGTARSIRGRFRS